MRIRFWMIGCLSLALLSPLASAKKYHPVGSHSKPNHPKPNHPVSKYKGKKPKFKH